MWIILKYTYIPSLLSLPLTPIPSHLCVCVCSSVMSESLWPHGLQPVRLLCPWKSQGKITGVGCHFLFQRIFWPRDQTSVSCISCIGRRIFFFFLNTEPPRKPQSTRLSSLCYTATSNWLYLIYTWCVYTSVLLFRFIPSPPTLAVFTSVFSISAFLFLLYKWDYQYNFF